MYDSVTRFLLALAEHQPLVILLDNLQLADRSSLGLLGYFCQHLAGRRLLVVVAYRDSEFERYKQLRPTLSTLSRTNGFTKLAMRGLSRPEVAELLRRFLGTSPPNTVLETVFNQSGGNPLFVSEVGSMLARTAPDRSLSDRGHHFAVPESLREVIATRLYELPEETRRMLRVASIVGREFDLPCLADLAEAGRCDVAQALQAAEDAGVIESTGPDRFQFHHVLFREVLYAEHNTVSRVLLHRRAGEHLEQRYRDRLQSHLTQLAYHFFEAAQTGREDKAIHFCRHAAKSAMARRAYTEATALLEQTLEVERLRASGGDSTRFELLMELGQAQYQSGHLTASTTTLMKAAIMAHGKRWWSRLAKALFQFQHLCQQSGLRHIASIPLHRAALNNIPESSVALRARALASLASAHRTNGDAASAVRSFRKSIALARELDDPQVLLACLWKGAWIIGREPKGVRKGLEVSLEALDLARAQGSVLAELDSLADAVFQLCDLGDIALLERRLGELRTLAVKERHVHFQILVSGFDTELAILRGQWEPAMHLARNALRWQPLAGVIGLEGRFAFQMFFIEAARGDLMKLVDRANRFIGDSEQSRLWLPGQILLHCELDQESRAREALDRLGDVRALPRDDLYPVALAYLADACARLGDTLRCKQLIELLMPYRGLNVTLPGTLMLGAASGYLAMLAVAVRRDRFARTLFEEAIELNSDMQALPVLARVQVEYARLLQGSKCNEDQLRARELLDDSAAIAERLMLKPLAGRIESLRKNSGNGRLTRREVQILELIAEGNSNLHIADALHVSHSTVATHIRNIFRKIGASNRTEAAEKARRSGLIATV
jgi:DNA-binding CsgD family transcriptional regulator